MRPRNGALQLAAQKAGCSNVKKGVTRGIAVHESFNSIVAQVVEASKRESAVKIERVICAVIAAWRSNPTSFARFL
jgi:isoquinoline 1-oxidoreductase subunit beta